MIFHIVFLLPHQPFRKEGGLPRKVPVLFGHRHESAAIWDTLMMFFMRVFL
jgi:hypothetical protein